MANGLGAGPSAIVTPDVNQLIGRPDIVVEPRSTAMLTDAFRQGFITADDIMERVGERSRLKKKVDIEQSKQALAELQDPELVQARRNQQLAAGVQAEGALANAPLAQKAKEWELKASIFDAQSKPGGFDAMQNSLTKAGFPVSVDVNTGLTDANKAEIQKRFTSLTQFETRKSEAESRVKGIETKFFPTEKPDPNRPGGKIKEQLEKLYQNGQEISHDQLKSWTQEAEALRKQPFSSYYFSSLQPGQVATAPVAATAPAAAPVTPNIVMRGALPPVTQSIEQLQAKRAQIAGTVGPAQVSQMSDAEVQAWQPTAPAPAPVATPVPTPATEVAPAPAQPAASTGRSFVTGIEEPPNVRPLQENTMQGQVSDRKEIKNAADARTAYAAAAPILKSINADGSYRPNIEDKRFNDFALIVAYAKIVDPGSVVREGETDRLRDAQDFVQKWGHSFPEFANVILKRQVFSPVGRKAIAGLIAVGHDNHQETQRQIVSDFANQAHQSGLNPALAVGADRLSHLTRTGWKLGETYTPKLAEIGGPSPAWLAKNDPGMGATATTPQSGKVFTAPNTTKKLQQIAPGRYKLIE